MTEAARRYRPELTGLRALACVLVVIYHVWLGRVSGGVDVFFLLSGFLFTGQLVRRRGDLLATWGRTLRRLLPAALTVLLVTVAVGVAVLPQGRWTQTIREIFASSLFVENWRLAADSADYFAAHNTASPVQHFWSLAVQGQFYLVWPLLIAGVALVARRRLRPVLAVVLALLFAGSLGYSIHLTDVDQPLAYFHSLTRVWEFALGGLVALGIDVLTAPRPLRVLLGWAGVAGLISCGLVFNVGTVFPGWVALWPTLSAALVLVAGATGSRLGVDRLLSTRPLRYLGKLSYSLYLWHWPVLVFYLVARDRAEVGLLGGAFVIGIAALLAVATYHLVEQPARTVAWGSYRLVAVAMVPVLLATFAWQFTSEHLVRSRAVVAGDADHPGALARTEGFVYEGRPDAPLAPSFVALPDDWAWIDNCAESPRGAELVVCTTDTPEPEHRIAIVGDSHPTQFIAALQPIAERRNWQLIVLSRGGCPFSTESEIDPENQACRDWNAAAADELLDLRPDVVFTSATRDVRVGLTEQTPPGFLAQWAKLGDAGIRVLAVRDNPRYETSPSECVEHAGPDAPECAAPRSELYAPDPPYHFLDTPSNVDFLDFSDYYCDEDVCPPVLGNVLLYLDDNHLSATYLGTMAPIVEQAIDDALGWAEAPTPA
ncbi:acyltransferase family protein [Amycolatopsis dongchuanensis]|uniref:Acyltransferase family protein n=1 Tax=Amycolatopsis dongchuanensis TaxID=1070866 RepID=A0ABP9QEN6_9PSEU